MKSPIAAAHPSADSAAELRRHLFYETSHSPALADLVGYERAKDIIDFCFIANPYYPTPEMLADLQRNLPNLIKSYPSSNPLLSQQNLAAVLHVDPEHLIIGNGATELIALLNMTLIDRLAVPIPTFGEYIEKMKDQRDAELYSLDPLERYELDLDDYLGWVHERNLKALLIINPGGWYLFLAYHGLVSLNLIDNLCQEYFLAILFAATLQAGYRPTRRVSRVRPKSAGILMTNRKPWETASIYFAIGGILITIGAARKSLERLGFLPRYAYPVLLILGLFFAVLGIWALALPFVEPVGSRVSEIMYGDPDRPHVHTHAQSGDLSGLLNLYSRYFAENVPSIELMRAWLNRCPTAFTLVYELAKDGGLVTKNWLVGSFKLLPLTLEGVHALESRQVTGSTLRPNHICCESDSPAAYYVGDVVATTRASRAALLFHLNEECSRIGEMMIYARPLTKDGLRIMKKHGFVQVCEGESAPEIGQLCRARAAGEDYTRRRRLRPVSR